MQTVGDVTYLGCDLNKDTDMHKEVSRRIMKCRSIFNRMHIFWCNSKACKSFKLLVYNSIIRSKLMYGLEAAQLNPPHIRSLETCHLKGLRSILKIQTTYRQIGQGKQKISTKAYYSRL